MHDDSPNDTTDIFPRDWLAELERERLDKLEVFVRRFAAGCDIWTGQPLAEAADQLTDTERCLDVCRKRRRPRT
jgi:hypothetical protein